MQVETKDGEIIVHGNKCKRGQRFAQSELTCPVRTFSTTVRTAWEEVPVLPVRVSADVPKDQIFDIMNEINQTIVTEPVGRGDAVISDVLGSGADVIVTSDWLKEFLAGER